MPIPQLRDIAPELVSELKELLLRQEAHVLAAQVDKLRIVDRCRCEDDFCGSFYTAPRPNGSYGPGHYTVMLEPADGVLIVDVVQTEIRHIEVLYRDDLRRKIHAVLP